MAVQTGISAINIGDGTANGHAALAIQDRVLKILYETSFTYKTATVRDAAQIHAGSVSYQVPQIVSATAYGDGTTGFQKLNSGLITVPIDIRRTVKYSYETFDASRLGPWEDSVLGMIASTVALSIENDLNANFWKFIVEQFDLTKGTLRMQNLTLPILDASNITAIPSIDDIKTAIFRIQLQAIKLNKTYNKEVLRVPKEELMIYFDPLVDAVIRQAYWNQPNDLGNRVVAKDLVGKEFGAGLWYYLEPMLNNSIPKGTSFADDYDLTTTGFLGFIIHNEAVAMPFNFNSMNMVIDPVNANPKFIAKYQFGLGLLRSGLIYSITKTAPTAPTGK